MTREQRRVAALERLKTRSVVMPRERLRALREAAGLGEKALGDKFDVEGPSVHDWEKGKRDPREENRKKIEAWSIEVIRALGVDVRPIFAGDWPHASASAPEAP
jgi:transcriptional regulator with XRE-family HTH domain